MTEMALGRMGDPEEDVGCAVASLASDDMSYLTGTTICSTAGARCSADGGTQAPPRPGIRLNPGGHHRDFPETNPGR
jgi:hypothetical protein